MADKSIVELPGALEMTDDALTVLYQNGETVSIAGAKLKAYARQSVVDYAADAAALAIKGATNAAAAAADSKKAAEDAQKAAAQSAEAARQSAAGIAGYADRAAQSAQAAQAAQAKAEAAAGKTSYIGENGNWYEWDAATGAFVDTGVAATGPQGPQGAAGPAGQSAYAAAQAGGYTDTQANFYADLAAMQGLAGELAAI